MTTSKLDVLVKWMRSNGVRNLTTDGVTIELDPVAPPAPPPAEAMEAPVEDKALCYCGCPVYAHGDTGECLDDCDPKECQPKE